MPPTPLHPAPIRTKNAPSNPPRRLLPCKCTSNLTVHCYYFTAMQTRLLQNPTPPPPTNTHTTPASSNGSAEWGKIAIISLESGRNCPNLQPADCQIGPSFSTWDGGGDGVGGVLQPNPGFGKGASTHSTNHSRRKIRPPAFLRCHK